MARIELDRPYFSPRDPARERGAAEQAMERCAAGDHTALGMLFDAIAPPLAAHLSRRVAAPRIDRIVRAVMLELHHARAGYVIGTEVLPWAIAIARRLQGAPEHRPSTAHSHDGSTTTLRLRSALGHVPEPTRSAWELVCLDRLSPTQAGRVLGIGKGRLREHLHAAERDLGPALRELDGTLDESRQTGDATADVDPLEGLVVLDRYRLVRRIGGGAHGDIYFATDGDDSRGVAVKVLRNEGGDPIRRRRFAREVELLRRIDDPGVTTPFAIGRIDGRDFFAMEYLHGHSLAQRVAARGRLPWLEVQAIGRSLCATLGTVHDHGVVHRDLKPGNCFVERDASGRERMRLLDFGVARLAEQTRGDALTEPGVLVGTPEYMAPEQLRGEAVDARTDVYALGVTLYELLVGRAPFAGASLVSLVTQHLFARPTPPSEALGDPQLAIADRALLRALAKDPADRWADAGELADALLGERRSTQHATVAGAWA
jgi:DNA-directed RNA polymerase specialized sigma24 family protein/predicted Ser/Thr protein kinase